MSVARKLLLFGGLGLAAVGMLYGLYYALFGEHQALGAMGGHLTGAFVSAAQREPAQSQAAIASYAAARYRYVRQVDAHSHWIGLAMLLIVLGAAFDRVAFSDRTRLLIATGLLSGSVVFPAGVILQTCACAAATATALAILGAGLVTASLALTLVGFLRSPA